MRLALILAAAAGLLTACSTPVGDALDTRVNAGPCPSAGAIYDSARIVEFGEGLDAGSFANIAYTGEIVGVKLYCRYIEDEPMLAEVEIDFAFGKGPKATSNSHTYPYFVAVTRRSSKVLNKERFAVQADFGGKNVTGKRELINRITIPRADASISGVNFEVVVGFELTEDQLAFNREGRRFRLDAAAGLE